MKIASAALLMAALVLLGGAVGAMAAPGFAVLSRMAKQGDLAQVEREIADARAQGALSREEDRFLAATVLARKGQLDKAEAILRQLLDEDPGRRLVRFELANVLWAQGQLTAARYHLDQLTLSEPDPRVRAAYGLADRAILDQRKWTAELGFGVITSNNANGGSTRDTVTILGLPFTIDPNSRAREASGLRYQASFGRQVKLGPQTTGVVLGFARGDHFRDTTLGYHEVGVGMRVAQRMQGSAQLLYGVEMSRVWSAGAVYSDNATLRLDYAFRPVGRSRWSLDGAVTHVNYANPAEADGLRGAVTLRVTRVPGPGREVGAYLRYSADASRAAAKQFDGVELGLSASRELRGGLTLGGALAVGQRQFRGPLPLQTFARNDSYGSVNISLTNRKWAIGGFAPQLNIGYEVQNSNSALFSYDTLRAGLSVSRRF